MTNIFISGACEVIHFKALANVGFKKFIISNIPSDDSFVSMKALKELLNTFPYCDFYLLEVPSNKVVYNYYEENFSSYGKRLQFVEDISDLELIPSIGFSNINSFSKLKGNYLFNISSFMKSYRVFDVQKCLEKMVLR